LRKYPNTFSSAPLLPAAAPAGRGTTDAADAGAAAGRAGAAAGWGAAGDAAAVVADGGFVPAAPKALENAPGRPRTPDSTGDVERGCGGCGAGSGGTSAAGGSTRRDEPGRARTLGAGSSMSGSCAAAHVSFSERAGRSGPTGSGCLPSCALGEPGGEAGGGICAKRRSLLTSGARKPTSMVLLASALVASPFSACRATV
jgi:hypothetical protein